MRAAAALLVLLVAACAPQEAEYYARLETSLRAAGFLRTDRAPQDAAYSGADLVRNFERIALYSEYSRESGRLVPRRSETVLSRWADPIRYRVVFGESVDAGQRQADIAAVEDFAARLGRLTGLDVAPAGADPSRPANFIIIFADRSERQELAAELSSGTDTPDPAFIDSLRNSPRQEVCYVHIFGTEDEPGRLSYAVTVIKAETRGLMRLSCIHEELAQALGLGNDDDRVRPSIFNDDEEFALLTEHDEHLLRMLYDPRLRPGMTRTEAEPLLPEIASDVLRRF
jgi:hypothetical protein